MFYGCVVERAISKACVALKKKAMTMFQWMAIIAKVDAAKAITGLSS